MSGPEIFSIFPIDTFCGGSIGILSLSHISSWTKMTFVLPSRSVDSIGTLPCDVIRTNESHGSYTIDSKDTSRLLTYEDEFTLEFNLTSEYLTKPLG